MKRFPIFLALILGGFMLMGADGCSSDPNVEGAKLDLRNKDYDRALENLETALAKNPDNAQALELKGRVLQEKAKSDTDLASHTALIGEMMQSFDRAVALDPALGETIHRNKAIAYVEEFQRGIQAFNRGNRNDEEAEFDNAIAYFENAAVIQPDSAGAYVNQAFATIRAGRQMEAIEPFEKAIERGENSEDTYVLLANLYQSSDRSNDAVTLLEEARSLYPESAEVQGQLLNAYQMAGQMDRAMEVYAEAVRLDPNNKLYLYNYGSLLLQGGKYEEAVTQLQKAVEIDPEYANAFYNIGAAYINQAVDVNERINTADDELRSNRSSMSEEQIKSKEAEIDGLANERKRYFEQAITPLEQARTLMETSGDDPSAVCQALFQAYVQTNQVEKGQGVQECAGHSGN